MSKSDKHSQQFAGPTRRIAHSIAQAVEVSGRSRSRIFKAIKDKELTAVKDGRATVITDEELRRWINAMPTIGRAKSEVRARGLFD